MKIKEVTTPQDVADFLRLPIRLYKDNPYWIRPLDKDIETVFDKERNKTFRHGVCCRWLLRDQHDLPIGRVAAFVNKKIAHKENEQPTGGMGFFECIDNREAAFMLFDKCKAWLSSKGMEAMDGPINFGNRDKWWGLLVDGFDKEPNYQCNYHHAYYRTFFEDYGFKVYFKQLTFARRVKDPFDEKLQVKADRLKKDPDYSFRHLFKSELPKLPEYITTVYNAAWASRAGVERLTTRQASLLVAQMKPVLDIKLLQFGFYKGEPVSFFISIPEVNQIFKYVNGKMDIWGKALFLWHSLLKKNKKAVGILFGVAPAHQGKGLDGAMIMSAMNMLRHTYKRYEYFEMNWIGDFNVLMIAVMKQLGTYIKKTHYTYRKIFDENKPFKRYVSAR